MAYYYYYYCVLRSTNARMLFACTDQEDFPFTWFPKSFEVPSTKTGIQEHLHQAST